MSLEHFFTEDNQFVHAYAVAALAKDLDGGYKALITKRSDWGDENFVTRLSASDGEKLCQVIKELRKGDS